MSPAGNGEPLASRIEVDLVRALKARDATVLDTLRLVKAAAKNREVEVQRPLTDEEYLEVMLHQAKMRQDAAREYDRAGRADSAEKERAELAVLQTYMPPLADDDAIRQMVERAIAETGATGLGDMGKVMTTSLRELRGKADGAAVSRIARELLAGRTGA